MIEELKKLPFEEQVKRLTNPDSLKEILFSVNNKQYGEYFEYLSSLDENIDAIYEQLFKEIYIVVEKSIDDNAFLRHLIFDLDEIAEILADYISEINDEFITSIISSTDSSKYCSEISSFIGYLLPEQLEKHSEEIKRFINDNDVGSLCSRFAKNMDILYYFLDKYPEKLVSLDDDTLSKMSRKKIKGYIKTGKFDFDFSDYDSSLLTSDPEYVRLFLENSNGNRLSGIGQIIDNVDSQYWDYELYLLALEKGYRYSSKSPDIIINNPDYLKAAIEYGAIDVDKLNKMTQDKFTPEILKLALEKGYEPSNLTPKYVFENYEYLSLFLENDIFKYIEMVPKDKINNEIIDLYLKNIYDMNHDYLKNNPLGLLPADIEKNSDLAVALIKYGHFLYVLKEFDNSVLESEKVRLYLEEIFPGYFNSSDSYKEQLRRLGIDLSYYYGIKDIPLSLPLVRTISSIDISNFDIKKFKNNNEFLKEFIKVSIARGNFSNLRFLTDEVVDDDICDFLVEGNFIFDSHIIDNFFNSFRLVKIVLEKYQLNIVDYLDKLSLDILLLNEIEKRELDKLIFQAIDDGYRFNSNSANYLKQFKYIKYAADNGNIYALKFLNFKNITDNELCLLSKNQLQCLKIYNILLSSSSLYANDFFDFIENIDNINSDGILLSEIYKRNFDFAAELSIIASEIVKNDLSQKQIQFLNIYSNIESFNLRQRFRDYAIVHPNLSFDQISSIVEIFVRISKSNSLEIRKLGNEISFLLLQLDDPIGKFEQIEKVFLKNNLPTVGKVYKVFEIMHPNFKGFNFNNGMVSPILSSKSNYGREVIVFADLIKSFIGSNNRSMNKYLNNLEMGNKLFIEIAEGRLDYNKLSDDESEILQEFVSHLNTLYNNTQKGKKENNKELTGNIINDISFLKGLFSIDGTLDYNLPDRIIKMYCHFAGIDTLEQAKQYVERKVKEADSRGRKYALGEFALEEGDFVKGIGDINYLGNILQNGSNSKEYLGGSAGSDATPLDTDLCIVLESGTINQCISNTATNSYGPIYFVLKNRDNRFTITRRSPKEKVQSIDTKLDLTKLEAFYTGAIGSGEHYGIRTGFSSSEIDYIVVNSYDDRIGLEIAMNGFYIPVVDRQGKLIFSPEEYDNLRSKMNGLSYYEMSDCTVSEDLETPEILQIASKIEQSEREVSIKRNAINEAISKVIQNYGLKLKKYVDGDIQEGFVELIDTGSTGRGTNMPGDGDFDYIMRLDKSIMANPEMVAKIKQDLLIAFGNSDVIKSGDFRLKGVSIEGLSVPVDIDITFVERNDKLSYSTDMCISDRLRNIRKQYPDKYRLVIANILEAKKILKTAGCYKPNRGDNPQGGLGGVGVENWILQNGGSFKQAIIEFLNASDGKSFEDFRQSYKIHDFGENHLAQKKGIYPHDNFVYNNMSLEGYEKMKKCLKKYLIECCKTEDVERDKTL